VHVISFEFTPEFVGPAFDSLEHLRRLGDIAVNFSLEENMYFEFKDWMPASDAVNKLSGFRHHYETFGDIYVRFNSNCRL
jgi:hypothetical protein